MANCKRCGKLAFFDTRYGRYSEFCSNTCRFANPNVQSQPQQYVKSQAVQGQPLCQMCSYAAWYDQINKKYSPGCGRAHAQQAISRGLYGPRN
jgi:hypothetical protein